MWLCAPAPGQDDPDIPRWAGQLIDAFTVPGDRVVIRGLAGYPGLAGETAALVAAAHTTGRRPIALLPTRSAAATTGALVTATAQLTTEPTAPAEIDRPAGVSAGEPAGSSSPAPVALPRVGVARRRVGTEAGGARLLVVLAGPVTPGARGARRAISPRLLASWSRVLQPGGLLVVLAPPPIGRAVGRARVAGGGELVRAAQDAGLVYTAHIVLVHTHVAPDATLAAPATTRRPHAPFRAVHTDLWLFTSSEITDTTDPTDPATADVHTVSTGAPVETGEKESA